jgi:predicted phage gp36 major capsid-like protein
MSMRAAVMTESVRPPEEHGTGTTARRASRVPSTARRRRAPSFKVTVVAALAGFLVVFELLAYQLRSGHDPAVGTGQVTAQVRGVSAGQSRQPSASGAVVTRASGATASVAQTTQPTSSTARASHASFHSIATRSSGGAQPGAPSSPAGDDAREHEGRA